MRAISFSNVQEAIKYTENEKNKSFILLSSDEKVKELSLGVSEKVVLCSTAGEYTSSGYKNGVISGFEYETDMAKTVEILSPPIKSIASLKSEYHEIENNKNAFILLFCDGLNGMEETIITTLYFVKDDFKIIGGSAGDNLKFKETYIYIGKKRVSSVALFFNTKQRTHITKENIYIPSGKRLLITEADTINRIVKSFNNKPASTEYARVLGVKESELEKYFMNNPLGKIYKDDIFIASPMKINEDKSITFYCQLLSNTFVQVLEPIDPLQQLRTTVSKLPFKPNFVFVINCILRSLKFEKENMWKQVDNEILKICNNNTTGFISYGEQFYKMHANQTMVMLIVE
ncbi:FIST signal transduction protein [Clostridium akagii]|uniref:FIST signal transduction protein n=1 Tax=Clostridium akagii TaxID=91623 RepID=UPI00047B3814|nr:FIST N-terminal domain-containing protein [Clostridium akagii]